MDAAILHKSIHHSKVPGASDALLFLNTRGGEIATRNSQSSKSSSAIRAYRGCRAPISLRGKLANGRLLIAGARPIRPQEFVAVEVDHVAGILCKPCHRFPCKGMN